MSTLEHLGADLGYLLIGLIWARGQAVRLTRAVTVATNYRSAYIKMHGGAPKSYDQGAWREFQREDPWFVRFKIFGTWDSRLRGALIIHALLWPLFVTGRLWCLIMTWTVAPVRKERAAVETLRERAATYRRTAESDGLPAFERTLLREQADELTSQAKKREL